jgi:hypothetical protein
MTNDVEKAESKGRLHDMMKGGWVPSAAQVTIHPGSASAQTLDAEVV